MSNKYDKYDKHERQILQILATNMTDISCGAGLLRSGKLITGSESCHFYDQSIAKGAKATRSQK